MPEKPYISQGANTGDDLYAMGAFPLGIGTFNPTDIINPGDTGLFAGFEPVMVAISTPNPGGVLLEAKTASGAAPLLISDAAKNQIWSLLTNIKPVQDLHGYANPWPAGGGENKFDFDGDTVHNAWSFVDIPNTLEEDTQYTIKLYGDTANNYRLYLADSNGTTRPLANAITGNGQDTFTTPADMSAEQYLVLAGDFSGAGNEPFNKILALIAVGSSAPASYSPYSNICPISGWTGCNVYVSPTTNAADATVYPCVWQDEAGTVYGGQIDVATGWMEVTHKMLVLDGTQSTMSVNWRPSSTSVGWLYHYSYSKNKIYTVSQMPDIISDTFETCTYNQVYYSEKDDAVSLVTNAIWGIIIRCHDTSLTTKSAIDAYMAANPVTVVFRLDSYEYYQVPSTNIFTLDGRNYIWTDCGDQITVQYAAVK